MRRIVPFAAAICLGACSAIAPSPDAPTAPGTTARAASGAPLSEVDVPYSKFVLANGLTVLIHEDHKAPLVGINIWYHVGSRDEPTGRHGFAHLFEHLMFTGSQHYDDEYFRALEPAGAVDINGTTNDDRTNFFETVPTSALSTLLFSAVAAEIGLAPAATGTMEMPGAACTFSVIRIFCADCKFCPTCTAGSADPNSARV